jgi:hypothetical protein
VPRYHLISFQSSRGIRVCLKRAGPATNTRVYQTEAPWEGQNWSDASTSQQWVKLLALVQSECGDRARVWCVSGLPAPCSERHNDDKFAMNGNLSSEDEATPPRQGQAEEVENPFQLRGGVSGSHGHIWRLQQAACGEGRARQLKLPTLLRLRETSHAVAVHPFPLTGSLPYWQNTSIRGKGCTGTLYINARPDSFN